MSALPLTEVSIVDPLGDHFAERDTIELPTMFCNRPRNMYCHLHPYSLEDV
jgi:hypothetical protein